jgi:predicted transcriptional regulator
MFNLRSQRNLLRISQSRVARLSGVSRFKICLFERGDGDLNAAETERIRKAIQAEADRLRRIGQDVGRCASAELTKAELEAV